jgi:phosphohistidine swiveling domain-containing protein
MLVAPLAFDHDQGVAAEAQRIYEACLVDLEQQAGGGALVSPTGVLNALTHSRIRKWEEVRWVLKLIVRVHSSEARPLIAAVIANTNLRPIRADSRVGEKMETIGEDIHRLTGEILGRAAREPHLLADLRLMIKHLPRVTLGEGNDLELAWELAQTIDEQFLNNRFSGDLRDRIHGHFSNDDYDLVRAYIAFLTTGETTELRRLDPFFRTQASDEKASLDVRQHTATGPRLLQEFRLLEGALERIVRHEPRDFEQSYRAVARHGDGLENEVRDFKAALAEERAADAVRLAGSVRRYFRKVLLEASDPGYRAQLAMLDEDAERLVYLQLGNFIRRVQAAPEQHLQDLALILAELMDQLGAYGRVSLNTAELCAHITEGRDSIHLSQLRDVARLVIDEHQQLGYDFLARYHDIGLAVADGDAVRVDQFIGALMRRSELDLHRAQQIAGLVIEGAKRRIQAYGDARVFEGNAAAVPAVEALFFGRSWPAAGTGPFGDARARYGSKGVNLACMSRDGIPVPEGFVLPASVGDLRRLRGRAAFDEWLDQRLVTWIRLLEEEVARNDGASIRFGDAQAPLILSVRSGSAVSMPGVLSTIPDIGINAEVVKGLIERTGNPWFAWDTYRLFLRDYAVAAWGLHADQFNDIIPRFKASEEVQSKTQLSAHAMQLVAAAYEAVIREAGHEQELQAVLADPWRALRQAIHTVLDSWEDGAAHVFREQEGLSHHWGTGVIVQRMRYGNLFKPQGGSRDPSLTGVFFTRDVHNAHFAPNGEYVVGSQGNDIVASYAGPSTIHTIPADLAARHPALYTALEAAAHKIDALFGANQDIEFTVEEGRLYILQSRNKPYEREHAVRLDTAARVPLARGVGVSGGGFRGVAAFLSSDLGALQQRVEALNACSGEPIVDGVVLLAHSPRGEDINAMLKYARGWVVTSGGRTSHAALMAKHHDVNAVFGAADLEVDEAHRVARVKGSDSSIGEGEIISIDGDAHRGEIYLGSVPFERRLCPPERDLAGAWPWLRAAMARAGVSPRSYDLKLAWAIENALAQWLLGPLVLWAIGAFGAGAGPVDLITLPTAAWAAFFAAHFFSSRGLALPAAGTVAGAGLLSLVGVMAGIEPMSILGLALHFTLNLIGGLLPDRRSSCHGLPDATPACWTRGHGPGQSARLCRVHSSATMRPSVLPI